MNVTIEFGGQKLVVDPDRLFSIVNNSETKVGLDLETCCCILQLLRKATPLFKHRTPYFIENTGVGRPNKNSIF